jgi:ABC-type transport system involved in multi-copper enzyme maturation permease subunit
MLRLLKHDLRLLLRDRLALLVLAIGLAVTGLAVANGARWIDHLEDSRSAFLQRTKAEQAEYRAKFAGPEWTDVDSADAPYTTKRSFAFPLPVLADFTIGRSDIEPAMAEVRMGYRVDTLFRNYQIDNPERLQRGRIDLSFVAIVVAPLLLIALGYGMLASDRDSGTLRLIAAQAGGVGRLIAARSINRLALVLAPLLLGAAVLLLTGPSDPARTGAALLWLGAALAGIAFWWAVILLVNALRVTAETSAFILIAAWILLVFAAPPLINSAAQALNPPPSRMAQIVESRRAEQQATETYKNDHGTDGLEELQRVKDVIAQYQRISTAHDRAIRPLNDAFERQRAAQQQAVRQAQWLSPPMTVSNTLAQIAGTDSEAYAGLKNAAFAYLADYQEALTRGIAGNRLFTLTDHDALPTFQPPAAARPDRLGVLWTLLVTIFALAMARGRYRRLHLV